MTTYTQFVPTSGGLFQFQLTLDGQQYSLVVPWSLFRKSWYIDIYDLQNNLILSEGLVGSPDNYDIDLVWGYFLTSTLVFRASTQQFEVNP
jgi:hypothetical protein